MRGKKFFAYTATLAYRVISTEVVNHIFKHNWIFRHLCVYKQLTSTKQWNFNIFVQILHSYFRYTVRHFLGCALFVSRCNTIRTSRETKKERLSYRKKYIEAFAWGYHFFDCMLSILCLFAAFFVYFLSFPKWHTCAMAAIKTHILLWVAFCVIISWVNSQKYENL